LFECFGKALLSKIDARNFDHSQCFASFELQLSEAFLL
jgi:hypothetical protein